MTISEQDLPHKTRIFNRVISAVLADLYREFPNPMTLDERAYGASVSWDEDSYEQQFKAVASTAAHSIEFLVREGFIHRGRSYGGYDSPAFPDMVLTLRGQKLLDSVPASVDESADRRPLGARFAEAVEGGKWGIAAQLIREFLPDT